jgi:hypothetical protein
VANSEGHAMADATPIPKYRRPLNPTVVEKHARRIVEILVRHFSEGATSNELLEQFEIDTGLKRQSFYDARLYASAKGWITGGGGKGRDYVLNPDNSWQSPSSPPLPEKKPEHYEYLLNLEAQRAEQLAAANQRLIGSRRAIAAGEAAGTAIGTLVAIMHDTTLGTRRRIQAAEQLLMFKSPENIAAAAKLFLSSIFTNPDENIDHRLAATTALRKSEDVRIMPAIERPPPRPDDDGLTPEQRARQLAEQTRRKHEHIEKMSRQIEAEMGIVPPATE